MLKTIIQPIATIHAEDGTLKAIRVFRVKVQCKDDSLRPFSLLEKATVRYTDIRRIEIEEFLDTQVLDVSMQDISKDKRLRNLITCKPWTLDIDRKATIRGAYAMPAIKADGVVVNPNIFQAIGSIRTADTTYAVKLFADAIFVDYAGNTYNGQQLKLKAPVLSGTIALLQSGMLASKGEPYTLTLAQDKTRGIGNLVAITDWYPSAGMSYNAADYVANLNKAKVSADILCEQHIGKISDAYSGILQRAAKAWTILDKDISSDAQVLCSPYSCEVVYISLAQRKLQALQLSRGAACLDFRAKTLPPIKQEAPLISSFINVEQGSECFPYVQGIAGVPLHTQVKYCVKHPTYINKPVSLMDTVYDAELLHLAFESQWCSTVTLPMTKSTSIVMPVETDKAGIILEPVKSRTVDPVRAMYLSAVWLALEREKVQNVLIKAQGTRRNKLVVILVYALSEYALVRMRGEPKKEPEAQPKTAMITTDKGTQCFNLTLGSNINATIVNAACFDTAEVIFSHEAPWERSTNQVVFSNGAAKVVIGLTTCVGKNYAVHLPFITDELKVKVPTVLKPGRKSTDKEVETVRELAGALNIYADAGNFEIVLQDINGNVTGNEHELSKLFRSLAVHIGKE